MEEKNNQSVSRAHVARIKRKHEKLRKHEKKVRTNSKKWTTKGADFISFDARLRFLFKFLFYKEKIDKHFFDFNLSISKMKNQHWKIQSVSQEHVARIKRKHEKLRKHAAKVQTKSKKWTTKGVDFISFDARLRFLFKFLQAKEQNCYKFSLKNTRGLKFWNPALHIHI